MACGRAYPFPQARLDVAVGGLVCARCPASPTALPVSAAVAGTVRRFRASRWEDGLRAPLGRGVEHDLWRLVEGLVAHLVGHPARASRFLEQTRRGAP
jgi:hypothetical protein